MLTATVTSAPGGDDGFDGNGRQAHRIDEAMLALAPRRVQTGDRQ